MNTIDELQKVENYKFLIQIKKNRKLKRNTKYLNPDFDFVEDINQAIVFPDLKSAEEILLQVSRLSGLKAKPRIIIKYIFDGPNIHKKI